MSKNLFYILLFLLANCVQRSSEFQSVDCNYSDLISSPNLQRVFKPCREFIYSAKYWDQEYNLISDERVWMMATGHSWEHQPESQDELIIQYNYDNSKIDFIIEFSLNPEFQRWNTKEVTGIIETGEKTWMHPFRSNQYSFTEVASFPSVQFPLETGKTWTSNLNIYDGWGIWSNSTLMNTYEVIDNHITTMQFGQIDTWHIRGITNADFGRSTHDFWYNEEYGFVKMFVKNYAGQLLQFELIEVKENVNEF